MLWATGMAQSHLRKGLPAYREQQLRVRVGAQQRLEERVDGRALGGVRRRQRDLQDLGLPY
jgi:hypothetical protein